MKPIKRITVVVLLVLAVILAGCENPVSSSSSSSDSGTDGTGTEAGAGSGGNTSDDTSGGTTTDATGGGGGTSGGSDDGTDTSGGTSGGTSGDTSGGTTGDSGTPGDDTSAVDVPPTPITITFVLDLDVTDFQGIEDFYFSLSTTATAPAPITATAGVPVRLDQGIGFTATGPGDEGSDSIIYHASGWSTEDYNTQYGKIMNPAGPAPSGSGYYLPGFEATFTEDTTLYIRWLPEFDTIAARITYRQPGGGANADTTTILHLRDEIPFESMASFGARIAPPWTTDNSHRVFEWISINNSFRRTAIAASAGEPAVWQFVFSDVNALYGDPATELQEITMTYESRRLHTVTFDYNGAPPVAGKLTREAFEGEQLQAHSTWWGMADNPVWNDYWFDGWYTDSGLTTDWFTDASEDVTLFAKWMATVTFNPNGGQISGNSGALTDDFPVDTNGTIQLSIAEPTTPHDTWDTFVGWYTDSTLNSAITLVDGRLAVTGGETLYAGWGPKYAVGSEGPGGGRIFHIADAENWPRTTTNATSGPFQGWKFLEVAPENASGVLGWSTPTMLSTRYTLESHDALGNGIASTNDIIQVHNNTTDPNWGYAAYQVRETYSSNSVSDWYLPSVVELKEIAASGVWQHPEILMGTHQYWSSSSYINSEYTTQSMEDQAYTVSQGGVVSRVQRNTSSPRARPIRRF